MPNKAGRFTEQERAFVDAYVATRDPVLSAKVAGYAQPDVQAYQKLANPLVLAEIERVSHVRITARLMPLAIDHCERVLGPESKASDRDKTQVAALVFKAAGARVGTLSQQEIDQATAEELDALIHQIKLRHSQRPPLLEGEAIELEPDDVFA